MFTSLYNLFTKKSNQAKQKMGDLKKKYARSNDPEIRKVQSSTKLTKAARGLAIGAIALFAFASMNISVPFTLAALASSVIIHGYGIESVDKKRANILKRKEKNEKNKAKYESERQQGKLQQKPEYARAVGQAKVNRYLRKHARQEAHIASLKKGQLTTSILTTAAALATFVTPFAGPLFALTTVGFATANGIIKNRTNKAEAEMEKDTEEHNDFINEHDAWLQQCIDQQQRPQQQTPTQQPTQQNGNQPQRRHRRTSTPAQQPVQTPVQPRAQQPVQTPAQPRGQQPAQQPAQPRAQQPVQTPAQPRTQTPAQQPAQNTPQQQLSPFDRMVIAEMNADPLLSVDEAIDRVNQQFAAWQNSPSNQLTK